MDINTLDKILREKTSNISDHSPPSSSPQPNFQHTNNPNEDHKCCSGSEQHKCHTCKCENENKKDTVPTPKLASSYQGTVIPNINKASQASLASFSQHNLHNINNINSEKPDPRSYPNCTGKKISVIVPVYNAEKFIAKNLLEMKKSLAKQFMDFEIIAVIDGNGDKSYEQAKSVEDDIIKVIGYEKNKGKGNALKYGFEHSTGDYITFLDCDMDIHPDQLKHLVPYMATADLVIASKRHPFSKLNYPLIRKILSRGFQIYSYIVLGTKLRDTQSGLKLMKREALEVILPLVLIKTYGFDLELCFLAQKHGFRTVEAPLHVTFQAFEGKSSASSLKTIRGMFLDVLAIRYRYTILRYYQKQFWKNMNWNNGDGSNGNGENGKSNGGD